MKAYRVSYYNTDCEGKVSVWDSPKEEYFISEEKANARAKEKKNEGWWIARVKVKEIEITE